MSPALILCLLWSSRESGDETRWQRMVFSPDDPHLNVPNYIVPNTFQMFSTFTTITGCFRLWTIIIEYWIFDSDECDICYVSCIWYAKAIPKGADNCAWLVVLVFGAIDDHLYFGVIVKLYGIFAWHLSITKSLAVSVIYSRLYKRLSLLFDLHLCFLWVFFVEFSRYIYFSYWSFPSSLLYYPYQFTF